MLLTLEVVSVLLVATAMALALAHALELPGKLRLGQDHYLAVQRIYYPGFTIGGVAEPIGLVATLVLAILSGGLAFWLTVAAWVALAAMHAAYWLLTHPVNRFWLDAEPLQGAGAAFFAFSPFGQRGDRPPWTRLRDRWEFSHLLRAGLGFLSLALLATAVAL